MKNAIDVFIDLVTGHPEIKECQIAILDFAPPLEKRAALGEDDQETIQAAHEFRSSVHLPFWDGIMLSANRLPLPTGVLKAGTYHQSLSGRKTWLTTCNLHGELSDICAKAHHSHKIVAVTSAVKLRNGRTKHIPFLDFHVGYSENGTDLATKTIDLLCESGALLKSGKSYHFYGYALLSRNQLFSFLGKALLFSPITDRTWIAHQLIERCCALRISPRPEYGGMPTLIKHCRAKDVIP